MMAICVAVVIAMTAGMSAVAGAHVGPAYYAVPIDPGTITIDGRGDDPGWNWPLWDPANTITKSFLGDVVLGGEMPSDENWKGLLKVGYSLYQENMLYFYSEVADDVLDDDAIRNGGSDRDDSLCILVDSNHDGGDYNAAKPRGAIVQQYQIRMSERDMPPGPAGGQGETRTFTYASPERAWVSGPPWMLVDVRKPVGRRSVTYSYEGKLALWDLAGNTPETSIPHMNAMGQTIGLSFVWNDADADPDRRENRIRTSGPGGEGELWNAGGFGDFILMAVFTDRFDEPSASGATSWGAIKASFQR